MKKTPKQNKRTPIHEELEIILSAGVGFADDGEGDSDDAIQMLREADMLIPSAKKAHEEAIKALKSARRFIQKNADVTWNAKTVLRKIECALTAEDIIEKRRQK